MTRRVLSLLVSLSSYLYTLYSPLSDIAGQQKGPMSLIILKTRPPVTMALIVRTPTIQPAASTIKASFK